MFARNSDNFSRDATTNYAESSSETSSDISDNDNGFIDAILEEVILENKNMDPDSKGFLRCVQDKIVHYLNIHTLMQKDNYVEILISKYEEEKDTYDNQNDVSSESIIRLILNQQTPILQSKISSYFDESSKDEQSDTGGSTYSNDDTDATSGDTGDDATSGDTADDAIKTNDEKDSRLVGNGGQYQIGQYGMGQYGMGSMYRPI